MISKDIRPITKEECLVALKEATKQIISQLPYFTVVFPKPYSEKGFYKPIENIDWTTGFWTGEIWLAYEYSQDKRLLEAANKQVESFLERIEKKIEVEHHDMGFLYTPSCVAAYRLTGNETARKAALLAADQLLSRYQPKGEFIQAWGSMDAPENYRLIIDCLLNVPLLYWATEETEDPKYREIGLKHTHTTLKNVIREDNSTWHTFFFNRETGLPAHGATCQGYKDGSAWARGQAWGIYGLALAYAYTKESYYIELFRRVTKYYLEHLPEDLVPYWDLCFNDGDDEPRDSSSASIVSCGLLEMAKYLEPDEAKYYTHLAQKMMYSLVNHYAIKDLNVSNGLVAHSTYSNHSPYNTCEHYGVDECNIWGDYFYMEALTRLTKEWRKYW